MQAKQAACCRCGSYEGGASWSSAPFIPESYILCADCMNAVLLVWLLEHMEHIEELEPRKAADHGHTGPA